MNTPSTELDAQEHVSENPEIHSRYVLKKPGRDPQAVGLAHFLWENYGLDNVSVTTGYQYVVQGINASEFNAIIPTVLSEAPVNNVHDHDEYDADILQGANDLLIEPLPGQFDQAADSASQLITLETDKAARVQMKRVIVFKPALNAEVWEQVKKFLINPTDSREASRAAQPLEEGKEITTTVARIEGFSELEEAELRDVQKEQKLSMTLPDMRKVQEYFKKKNRAPSVTELKVIDTYWSDHCRHTTFTTELTRVAMKEVGKELSAAGKAIQCASQTFMADREAFYGDDAAKKKLCLMDLALFSMREAKAQGKLNDLENSEENNAASIVVPVTFADGTTEEWLLMFKNETHNHPTEIEPYGGAATCLGGAIRDPLSGRARVIMGMRVTGAGDPRASLKETLPGKLPQRTITTGAAAGFAGYGNQIGVPTLGVHEYNHPGFEAKRMEVGFVAGAVRKAHVRRETPAPGDVVIVLGGATGRDGIGGASGSSRVHTGDSVATLGAEVQKGNPVIERCIQRLFDNPKASLLIKRCNDFGAGGASVAIGEIAKGVDMNLDLLTRKYVGLDGTELAISESQERMAIVVSKEDAEAFIQLAAQENLDATVVGAVKEEEVLREYWNGDLICELDRDFLEGGWAERTAQATLTDPGDVLSFFINAPAGVSGNTLAEKWLSNMQRLEVASQRGLQQRFDSTVGANTVVGPYGGLHQNSPSEAAITAFPAEGALTTFATAESYDPHLSSLSPYHGGMFAVIDSMAKLVASGASPKQVRLTLQNYFGKLTDAERWGQPYMAQLGAREAQKHLEAPAIGGKDSMSGTFMKKFTEERMDVPPTLVSFAVATMNEEEKPIPSCFQTPGSTVVHLPVLMTEGGEPDWKVLKQMWLIVHHLQMRGLIKSSTSVHAGGVAASISKMAMGNRIGMSLANVPSDDRLFASQYGSMVIELAEGQNPAALFSSIPFSVLGTTSTSETIEFGNDSKVRTGVGLTVLQNAWEQPLEKVFPINPSNNGDGSEVYMPSFDHSNPARPPHRVAHPKVSVLTFPGTNCEMETAAAFNRAGARANPVLFLNRTLGARQESIARMAKEILSSEIVVIPGGFSGGDEPDGSAKYIASVLRNPQIRDAMHEHIGRGGLVLGICNGFQALVKSCLLPNGNIDVLKETDMTLAHSDKGHFLSMNNMHTVTSTWSPWMAHYSVGEHIDISIAHGEGKLIQVPHSVWLNGQVPLQYAGRDGVVRNSFPANPNGSEFSAAGLTDVTGRIFGLMGHPERAIPGRSVHIPTPRKGHRLFEAGVRYFQ